jgi:hypothetical protein
MIESKFLEIFKQAATQNSENKFVIEIKKNLLYELFLDRDLNISPTNSKKPKRGNSAFQTDLCVFEKYNEVLLPRIVIEFKTKITTHDIITYSGKAGKHKAIYPSLRYGLLASEIDKIPNRFFIHNENIDFFIAAKKYKEDKLFEMATGLIKKEIDLSRILDKINFGAHSFDYFRSEIILENFIK